MACMLSIQSHIFQKEAEFDKHHYEMGQSMSHDAGSWKILKYGRPITIENKKDSFRVFRDDRNTMFGKSVSKRLSSSSYELCF